MISHFPRASYRSPFLRERKVVPLKNLRSGKAYFVLIVTRPKMEGTKRNIFVAQEIDHNSSPYEPPQRVLEEGGFSLAAETFFPLVEVT